MELGQEANYKDYNLRKRNTTPNKRKKKSLTLSINYQEMIQANKCAWKSTKQTNLYNQISLCKHENNDSRKICCDGHKSIRVTDAKQRLQYTSTEFRSKIISDTIDISIRLGLVALFIKLETTNSFKRKIQLEELWLYKFPQSPDIVSPSALLLAVTLGPFSITLLYLLLTRNLRDFRAGTWTWTLALCLNGLITSLLKITVGRPRPDFFYRCFPDGILILNNTTLNGYFDVLNCTGNQVTINEGYKSFPSGHSSFAFTGASFIALYVGAKLHAFSPRGRGQTWRLFIVIFPMILAGLVAVSRTCDYHHHWQDVLVGSLIGLCVTYFVYRQYYPSILSLHCDRAYQHGVYIYKCNCSSETLLRSSFQNVTNNANANYFLKFEGGNEY